MLFYVIVTDQRFIFFTFDTMKKNARFLILFCSLAITGLLAVQLYWILNYYSINKKGFEKEVNLAFEDALKKEFSLRCDTITQLIVDQLLDTSAYDISSQLKKDSVTMQYTISSKQNKKDNWQFSLHNLNQPITATDTLLKKTVAQKFAETLRNEDLESHMIFYRTQSLGSFMQKKVTEYNFDTARLRPLLTHYLLQRDITVPFQFYLKQNDSTMNYNHFPKELLAKYPVITKSYPTYKLENDSHYVRAMFVHPYTYVIGKMKFIFISSILLVICVMTCFVLLFKMWFREKKLSAVKNDFINNITHEFKTPIATVSAAVEALSDFGVLENKEQTHRYLGHSKNELQRLSGMVDQLLNISLYENNRVQLKPEQINLKEAINAVMQPHLMAPVKPIHFSYTNNTAVPFIKADKTQFHHAVNNIIDNAIKYSGSNVTITVECSIKDHFLVLAIADNGNGIASNEIPLVFDKFYRVNTADHRFIKGYGLGLNYVKNIMDLHGGWCVLKSKTGQGTVVSLAWPI